LRQVEAEVGPIKYIAAFFYGSTNPEILEKAVTWVIIILIVVFDPMAVILLLASQISFQNFREQDEEQTVEDWFEQGRERSRALDKEAADAFNEVFNEPAMYVDDVDEKSISEEIVESIHCHKCNTELVNAPGIGLFCPNKSCDVKDGPFSDEEEKSLLEQHPYLIKKFEHFENLKPMVYKAEGDSPPGPIDDIVSPDATVTDTPLFVQNEEQAESNLWSSNIPHEEYYQISQLKLEAHAEEVAGLVRKGQMKMSEVPEPLQPIVKAKV
jgi:hypothetical protein